MKELNLVLGPIIEEAKVELLSSGLSFVYQDFFVNFLRDQTLSQYFLHKESFPTFYLLALGNKNQLNSGLVKGIIYGYLSIRIQDEVMDSENKTFKRFLPLCHDLYHRFTKAFRDVPEFSRMHEEMISATIIDNGLASISLDTFEEITSKKLVLAKLALLASTSLTDDLNRMFDLLCFTHQMQNDFYDWQRDELEGLETHFLTFLKEKGALDKRTFFIHGISYYQKLMDDWFEELRSLTKETPFFPLIDFKENAYREKAKTLFESGLQLGKLYSAMEMSP